MPHFKVHNLLLLLSISLSLGLASVKASAAKRSCKSILAETSIIEPYTKTSLKVERRGAKSLKELKQAKNIMGAYISEIEQLKGLIVKDKKLGDTKEIRQVLYLFSGIDSALPVSLFSEADRYISVDNHPFTVNSLLKNKVIPLTNPMGSSYIYTVVIDAEKMAAPGIIANLQVAVGPNLRIRKITAFDGAPSKKEEHHNGVIEFDTGPGTSIKEYVHFQDTISPKKRPKDHAWFSLIEDEKKLGVIVKGSQSTLEGVQMPIMMAIDKVLWNSDGGFAVAGKGDWSICDTTGWKWANAVIFKSVKWGYDNLFGNGGVEVTRFENGGPTSGTN